MKDPVLQLKEHCRTLIAEAFSRCMKTGTLPEGEIPAFVVEIPADISHGDLATNAAMVSARVF